ncbi:MAG: SCO family protein [Phycisphaerales bacterium]
MSNKAFPAVVIGVVALIAFGSTWALLKSLTQSAPRGVTTSGEPFEPRVPDFEFTDQSGNRVTAGILDGHYTVLDFMFTNCPLWCPGMTQAMAQVQDATAGGSLRFLSISIDGSRDTPERLAEWAAEYDADLDRWSFLTGAPNQVWPIVGALGFDVSFDDQLTLNLDDGSTMANINHPTRLLLVAPDRRVIGMYAYQSPEDIDALIERARELAP